MRSKRRRKKNFKLFFLCTLAVIFLSMIFISIGEIILWKIDSNNTNKQTKEINKYANVEEINDSDNTELVNAPENENSDYWYYIKFPLINVNFDELKKKNNETVAWINVNNTNINYPIVQTNNNDFYLNHSYDKKYNEAGGVFLDYRNNKNFTDQNTVIYAHSRLDKTMFGSLSKTLHESWYQNKDNHIIRISNEYENSLWQIFSIYIIETESYYITTGFNSGNQYQKFLDTLVSRSKYDFNTKLDTNDRIITLSTCYDDNRKTVVHAKLLKKETR